MTDAAVERDLHIEVEDEGLDIRGLRKATAGYSLVPLGLLFTLNFVDEFDRIAFAALTPEIRNAFGLSDTGITAVAAVTSVFALLAALPLGILADRTNRVRISVAAGFLWGIAAVATGLVWAVPLLYLVRFLSGVGRITNEVVHPSLLSDYYPSKAHPQVYGAHRLANAAAPIAGPIAGVIAGAVSWEAAFFVLAIPTGFALLGAFRLREPNRGESVDAELAASQADKAPIGFAEARKQLFAIPTLKRFYWGAFFFGIGTIQLSTLISLYFENVFDFGPAARGWVQFVLGAGTVTGLVAGSRLAANEVRKGNLPRLGFIVGAAFSPFALGMVILAAAPVSAVALVGAFVIAIGNGGWQPSYFSLLGTVAPPRLRSQAYAFGVMIYGAGGLAYVVVFGAFGGEEGNYRGLTIAMALITAVAGAIGISTQRFIQGDADNAAKSLAAAQEFAKGEGTPILRCRDVDLKYGTVQILFGVDMDVYEGEIIALLGTNGAGKSTILKAISGLAPPCGGQIIFDGEDITYADAVATSGMGIVVVPGGKAVFPTLTVAEHFECGSWLYGDQDPKESKARQAKVLEEFPRLQERWNQLAGNLSGGEQQQLAVGMAFVAKPKLLVIDELSLGLAPTIVEQLLRMVREIHAEGTTIILVEQSINVALTIATRAFFMEKGEVRFDGKTEELLERGDILRSVFLEGTGGKASENGAATPAQDQRAADALAAAVSDKAGVDPGQPVLSVHGLQKRFGGITATNDVSFDLMPGQIIGLIGPNGAGKTTIFDEISGFLKLDGGRVVFRGQDVTNWAPEKRAAHGLGRSFQDARIFSSLTVSENIALGLERHIEVRDHLSPLLGLPAVFDSEMDVRYTVDDLIELMNLGDYRNKFVSELSTGSRRIVDLAMAIAHDPTVLLLDEPSSGIAQKETEALGPLIKRIQREAKCAVLVIEHDMPLITSVSDEIIALELGEVVVQGDAETVLSNKRVVDAYLGGDLDIINRSGGRPDDETLVTPAEHLDRATPPPPEDDGQRRRREPLVAPGRESER
ncbi:MFS transporter [Actinospongicola halichondriae]|uniref:MFS transporter n=1 Tax=Actinospongicola halichondriae TaxID=3236844 RepID=UPI003D44E9E4